MNITANSFEEAIAQIPTAEDVMYVFTFMVNPLEKNKFLSERFKEGDYFYFDHPEQLNYQCGLRQGAHMYYGYGDIPANAVLNAINSYTNRKVI